MAEHLAGVPGVDTGRQHLGCGEATERVQVDVRHLEVATETVNRGGEAVGIDRSTPIRERGDYESVRSQLDAGVCRTVLATDTPLSEKLDAGCSDQDLPLPTALRSLMRQAAPISPSPSSPHAPANPPPIKAKVT